VAGRLRQSGCVTKQNYRRLPGRPADRRGADDGHDGARDYGRSGRRFKRSREQRHGRVVCGGASHLPKLAAAIERIGPAAAPETITVFIDDDDAGRRHGRELATALMTLSRRWGGDRGHFEVLINEGLK
jgi:hypothetical protein